MAEEQPANGSSRGDRLAAVRNLGIDWQAAGSLPNEVLDEFVRICPAGGFRKTLETGSGRSTLLLSHLSASHTVFTFQNPDPVDDSYQRVKSSPLLNPGTTHFVLGPSQRTLPAYPLAGPYDLVLLDGPHGFPFPELEYYLVYPHLQPGGWLVVDDIHIPTIHNLYSFLREDDMYRPHAVVGTTAFFARTDAPVFDPLGDGWENQQYNRARFPIRFDDPPPRAWHRRAVGRVLPRPVKRAIKALLGG